MTYNSHIMEIKRGVVVKSNLIACSIFCLAICFVIGSWLLSTSLKNGSPQPTTQSAQHQLFTQPEVAEYLGISIAEVQKITEIPNGQNSYTSEIPHIKIDNNVYYPKKAIDRWLQNVELTVVP